MSAWITDRLPTREDADCVDEVTVTIGGKVRTMNFRNVSEDLPWMRTPHPEPYVKPKVWGVNSAGVYKNDVMVYWDELRREHYRVMEDALNRLEEGV